MSRFKLSIVTPEGVAFRDDVDGVVAPGVEGSFGTLRGHAPMISALKKGLLKVRVGDGYQSFSTDGGFLEVRKTEVVVLASNVKPQ